MGSDDDVVVVAVTVVGFEVVAELVDVVVVFGSGVARRQPKLTSAAARSTDPTSKIFADARRPRRADDEQDSVLRAVEPS